MEEEDLGAIGFMFDAEHSKETRTVDFGDGLSLTFKLIGDQPGHVQSGLYLWPAASFAARHLIANWEHLRAPEVMELGAGCGVTGLVVSKLPGVESVVFTDYDNGSIELIQDNIDINSVPSSGTQLSVHFLEWGKPISNDLRVQHRYPSGGFRLVVGADLLYCHDVVVPLFTTVSDLLSEEGGIFMLTTSFYLDEKIEATIVSICDKLRLSCENVVSLNETAGISKVQYFRSAAACNL